MSDQLTRERRQRSLQYRNRNKRHVTPAMRAADRREYEDDFDPMEAAYSYLQDPEEGYYE